MDVLDRLGLQTAFLCARGLKRVWILTLAGWLTSCSSSTPPPTSSFKPESFNELKQRISSIRELPFKRDVSTRNRRTQPERRRKEFLRRVRSTVARPYLARLQTTRTSTRIHRFSRGSGGLCEVRSNFLLRRSQGPHRDLTGYDSVGPGMTTAEPARNLAQRSYWPSPERYKNSTFNGKAKLNGIALEDRRLAFRALAVGDTVLLGTAYLQGSQRTTRPPDSVQNLAGWATALEKWARNYPNCCNKSYYFPIARAVNLSMGSCGQRMDRSQCSFCRSATFDLADSSPTEILRQTRKSPVIRASGLARQMTESATVDQTLGEYLVQLLLTSNLTRQEARQIAAGWTGDQLSAYLEGEIF